MIGVSIKIRFNQGFNEKIAGKSHLFSFNPLFARKLTFSPCVLSLLFLSSPPCTLVESPESEEEASMVPEPLALTSQVASTMVSGVSGPALSPPVALTTADDVTGLGRDVPGGFADYAQDNYHYLRDLEVRSCSALRSKMGFLGGAW